jgi:hypothetical protein
VTEPSILRGDARALPLPDASVDLIVTSPPYFGLRSYTDGGEHYDGQIGAEPTPQEFIAALVECTREMVRVLKPTGSIFVNLGDVYMSRQFGYGSRTGGSWAKIHKHVGDNRENGQVRPDTVGGAGRSRSGAMSEVSGVPRKSLMLLPERYRIACVDELGLIARAVIVWSKPNCLSGGTMVYAKIQGRPTSIKVHDLCRHYQPEDVQLWNGQRWTQVVWWQPTGRHPDAAESYKAIRAARRRGDEPVVAGDIEIELRSGERIGCTRDHRWPTQRGLVHASELVVGDVLATAPLPEGDVAPAALDDEMVGWFVGLYIAEGSRSEQTIQIAGHVRELERFKRLSEIAAAFHGTCRVHATGGNGATINLTGGILRAIIDTYIGGRTAKDKHLAPKCWQRSNRFLRAVLDGYLSGDGHWREDANRWILGFTDNDALAADLRALGARLGLSVRLKRTTHTGFGKEWPGWGGNITDPARRRAPDSEIVAIRQSRARQFWDIGVEDDPHLFALASGVLTHNSLPESVTDRVRRSHEDWVHLTKSPKYFAAVDEIREPTVYVGPTWEQRKAKGQPMRHGDSGGGASKGATGGMAANPLGKLPGSVWEISTQPLRVPAELGIDHFAAQPMEWPRRLIRGWSPREVCTACGEGRRPVSDAVRIATQATNAVIPDGEEMAANWAAGRNGRSRTERTITGYACACPDTTAPATPGVVLDPFGGTGTTALVAAMHGRQGISVDASADYCRLAEWRCSDPKQRERAARAAGSKPAPVATITHSTTDEPITLFDLFDGEAAS